LRRLVRAICFGSVAVASLAVAAPAGAAQAPHWGGRSPVTTTRSDATQWGGPSHRVRPVYTPPPAPPAPTPPPIVGAPVAGGCARNGIKVSGTISGEDGDYVNVMLGFDLQNSAHQPIGLNGCTNPAGYGATVHLNHCVTAYGSPTDAPTGKSYGDCATLRQTKTWSVVLPGNAAYMYIEAYPKKESSAPQFGTTDKSKYGMSYRRSVPVGLAGSRAMKLPVVCGQGGHTGTLVGHGTVGGRSATVTSVNAWSMAADSDRLSPILGMNTGQVSGSAYTLDKLVPGNYTLVATVGGVGKQLYNVPVRACATTTYNLSF
jgi:hypothetical protein